MLQRILASRADVSSTAEPWLLLPFVYAFRHEGIAAEYDHPNLAHAHSEFLRELPHGYHDFADAVRAFALTLYSKASSPHAAYFLDKTPSYALISHELIELFPEGKFIFLWRNPLAVVASWLRAFDGGRWRVSHLHYDLLKGLPSLVRSYSKHANRCLAVRFEDLVQSPRASILDITSYLNLPFDDSMLTEFSGVTFAGDLGDPTRDKYDCISAEPIAAWKAVYHNAFRKSWARRYLAWLGEHRLHTMGYSQSELYRELRDCPASLRDLISDAFWTFRDSLRWRIVHSVLHHVRSTQEDDHTELKS